MLTRFVSQVTKLPVVAVYVVDQFPILTANHRHHVRAGQGEIAALLSKDVLSQFFKWPQVVAIAYGYLWVKQVI